MNLHGDLAESWETPDALTYVFHLRRGVRFHDDQELTSADVKATFGKDGLGRTGWDSAGREPEGF